MRGSPSARFFESPGPAAESVYKDFQVFTLRSSCSVTKPKRSGLEALAFLSRVTSTSL